MVVIPDSVTNLTQWTYTGVVPASGVFANCSGLKSVTLGKGLPYIGPSMFYGCSGLESVAIPDNVKNIGAWAFHGCSGMTTLSLGNGVTNIGANAFANCSGLVSLDIPDNVATIGDRAFTNCTSLRTLTIPKTVRNLGACVFSNCTQLTSAVVDCSGTIPYGLLSGCSNLTSVVIGDNVEGIKAFVQGCSKLTTVSIGRGVTNIVYQAFAYCIGLQSVVIPENVTRIENRAFEYTGLTSVRIPDGVTSIESSTFYGCSNLMSVSLGKGVTNIGDRAFAGCSSLPTLTMPSNQREIYYSTFYGCSGLKSLAIPGSVTNIGMDAFEDCSGLSSITIPEPCSHIGGGAFWRCTGLSTVRFKGGVPEVDSEWDSRSGFYALPFYSVAEGARGYYTAEYAAEWKAAITNGTWCGLIMEEERPCTLSFDANGGMGSMAVETVPLGATQVLPGNMFERENYVFAGWAETADGDVAYGDGAEVVVEKNMTFYAVWKFVGGTIRLCVDSASPAEGSLTLGWEDEGGGEGMTYSVWRGAGKARQDAKKVASGLTGKTWEDKEYWRAEPVLVPLNYWVVAEGIDGSVRESDPVETRHRLGVCVGYGEYGKWTEAKAMSQSLADANLCKSLAEKKAGFSLKDVLKNSDATAQGIHDALAALAEEAKPGDTVLFYIATHGGVSELQDKAGLWAYDKHYYVTDLAADVAMFDQGVGFIGIIMACYSQAFADPSGLSWEGGGAGVPISQSGAANWLLEHGLAECKANVAWVTSCGMDENSANVAGLSQSMFGEWFLRQGWEGGYADAELVGLEYDKKGKGDGTNTFLDLAQYARVFALGNSDANPARVYWQNDALLGKSIAAVGVSARTLGVPPAPPGLTASKGEYDTKVRLKWTTVGGDVSYRVYRGDECVKYQYLGTVFDDTNCAVRMSYPYRVRAFNATGIGGFSGADTGYRGTDKYVAFLGDHSGGAISSADATAEELATVAASVGANGHSIGQSYIAGLDPDDPRSVFNAELVREGGKWKARPVGGKKAGRVYRVEGKKSMTDEEWEDVTDVEDLEGEGWRFFRVGVELAE